MAQPPDTVLKADPAERVAICRALRDVSTVETPYGVYRPATIDDADAFFTLLADPHVSGPLYTIPKPVTRDWVERWIEAHQLEAAQGAGLLMLARDGVNQPTGFVDLQVWSDRASAEFGGGISPDLQSASLGTRGAAALFDWLFQKIDIRLIAMTNALNNVRTEKLLRHLGFVRLTDRVCVAEDGTKRLPMYWALKREDWRSPYCKEETHPGL